MAQEVYHQAVCDRDVDAIAKDVSTSEAIDSLYFLIVMRALAMAETQSLNPLDLADIKYIWGDFNDVSPLQDDIFKEHVDMPRTLPWNFKTNVILPLQTLEKMDINIFEDHRFDTWILNTIFAKVRGTASARPGPDGKPEVGAVHPMWCLANHSCDPNVKWEWEGTMKFWVMDQRVDWYGKHGRVKKNEPGLKEGQEVFGHYCDLELNVTERREWAAGALGGACMCERCVWEEKQLSG